MRAGEFDRTAKRLKVRRFSGRKMISQGIDVLNAELRGDHLSEVLQVHPGLLRITIAIGRALDELSKRIGGDRQSRPRLCRKNKVWHLGRRGSCHGPGTERKGGNGHLLQKLPAR